MNSPVINLSFRYAESDYTRALRAHYVSYLRLRLDIVFIIVVFSLGIYMVRLPHLYWLGLFCVITTVVFAFLLVAAFTIIPSLAFRREIKFCHDYFLTFSAEGIHFRTTQIDSQLQWGMYSRVLMDGHSYILYYGTHQFTIIPKRLFSSVEQQKAFELLLTQNIPQIVSRDT